PETGASCSQPTFDVANPPAFDASPRTSKDIQMNGVGAAAATNENGMGAGAADTRPAGGAATAGANDTTASK
ncbi:MAG: DUF3105 domain-containing protein, partial [Nakamurella sp.]